MFHWHQDADNYKLAYICIITSVYQFRTVRIGHLGVESKILPKLENLLKTSLTDISTRQQNNSLLVKRLKEQKLWTYSLSSNWTFWKCISKNFQQAGLKVNCELQWGKSRPLRNTTRQRSRLREESHSESVSWLKCHSPLRQRII